ncbi:isochorismatase family protein [Candidimonas sp. SYP-B2681]|uniref:cysteine hydrolase family protein n=1 Tax=Candidimonas sp. SYP-B2681 TaxID=2497686 RepID=UPI000F8971D8|nr:isochorismatase family protein [Candidimonas sp. SYP-B2681]RTZ44401.1 isochorismatase family protein [Candidimonas sp. SYP-B2681]
MNPWEQYLSPADRAVIDRAKFGRRMGFGKKPAIIVIDVQRFMIGDADAPMAWPSNSGEAGHAAIPHIQEVLRVARAHDVPCFFAAFEIDASGKDMGVYRRKRDLLETENWCLAGSRGAELLPELEVNESDIIFVKKKPSGFHGTPLLGYLIEREIDTVIIVGGSTSNCIRATVFDASSYNYRTIVVREGVFDRIPISNAISLFDMDRQFADVVSSADVVDYLSAPSGCVTEQGALDVSSE